MTPSLPDSSPQYPKLPEVHIPAGTHPIIIIDTREQDMLPISHPFAPHRATLPTGDYSYLGGEHTFAVERKSIADLVGCLGVDRERFQRQLERLRGYDFRRLLVVGNKEDLRNGNYRSRLDPLAAVNGLKAIEARYCPVVWADTQEAGARLVEDWAFWHYREMIKAMRRVK